MTITENIFNCDLRIVPLVLQFMVERNKKKIISSAVNVSKITVQRESTVSLSKETKRDMICAEVFVWKVFTRPLMH